jgi:hypothetical protein
MVGRVQSSSARTATLPVPVPAEPPPVAAEVWTPRLWAALLVLCGALFLDGLDVSMVGVALPSIAAEFQLPAAKLQWVVSG